MGSHYGPLCNTNLNEAKGDFFRTVPVRKPKDLCLPRKISRDKNPILPVSLLDIPVQNRGNYANRHNLIQIPIQTNINLNSRPSFTRSQTNALHKLKIAHPNTRVKISQLVASLQTSRQQVVFARLVTSCQQVWNKLLTTCNNLVDIIRLVTRLSQQGCYNHDTTILLQPCVVNLVNILVIS